MMFAINVDETSSMDQFQAERSDAGSPEALLRDLIASLCNLSLGTMVYLKEIIPFYGRKIQASELLWIIILCPDIMVLQHDSTFRKG